jgi:hypothetical protein
VRAATAVLGSPAVHGGDPEGVAKQDLGLSGHGHGQPAVGGTAPGLVPQCSGPADAKALLQALKLARVIANLGALSVADSPGDRGGHQAAPG